MFLTAQPVDAEEMRRIGFLSELVEPADLPRIVSQYVDAIVECEPKVVGSMKHFLNQTANDEIDPGARRSAYEHFIKSEELGRRFGAIGKGA